MLIDHDLYEIVLKKNILNSNKLEIISGFGSAAFLKKILKEFSEISIDLYLGMTPNGITNNNHKGFLEIQQRYPKVNIFYQIESPVTHIKLYSFWSEESGYSTYAGSANFSENGFINWHECLLEANVDTSQLFNKQKKRSILCNDIRVKELVKIYDDKTSFEESSEETNEAFLISEEAQETKQYQIHGGRTRYDFDKRYLEIPILLTNVATEEKDGINSYFNGKKQYLVQSNNYPFSKYFETDTTLIFITDDSKILHGNVPSTQTRKIFFQEDIYEYISDRLGNPFDKPITRNELKRYGKEYLSIEKVEDNTYKMYFCTELNK